MLQQSARWNGLTNENHLEENADGIVQTLLHQRGLTNAEAEKRFLHPSLDDIQEAGDLFQIDHATKRIHQAIEDVEQIVVFGDYDADGITSTALLFKALQQLEAFCDFYIPNRLTEGYGLNNRAIEQLHREGVTLIITVDNGIACVEEVEYAKSLGIDVIITDHHEVQANIPDAYATIHPKLSDAYMWKELAGVGVAFQLATKLLGYMDETLLDLVAIGTVADLVPLLEENRVFTYFGLQQLETTKHIGLKVLMDHCGVEMPIAEDAIGFRIGPRLNAVGRLDHAAKAVQLLVTEDEEEAKEIVAYIDDLNVERQQMVTKIVKEAEDMMESLPDEGVIMLYDETWHEGVLGIVASRIVSKYHRPTFIFTHKTTDNVLKGSARSIPAFDLFTNCMEMKDTFIAFGGHAQAAGMTLEMEELHIIWDYLNEQLIAQCGEEDYERQLTISQSISLDQLTESFVAKIQAFAPFGMGNTKPLFHVTGEIGQVRTIGQKQNHLKIQLSQANNRLDCVAFHKGKNAYYMNRNSALELVGYVQINEWNGNRTVQMLAEDMRITEKQIFDYRGRKAQFPLEKTLELFQTHVIVQNEATSVQIDDHKKLLSITYEQALEDLQEIDVLYIFDLPQSIEKMIQLLQMTNPKNIYLCYDMDMSSMFEQLPTRDEFKWVYAFVKQTEPALVSSKISEVIQARNWKQDKVIFIFHVLLELQFIYLEERIVYVHDQPIKKPLHEAKSFMERENKQKMDQLFYQETLETLSQWIIQQTVNDTSMQEEIVHEL